MKLFCANWERFNRVAYAEDAYLASFTQTDRARVLAAAQALRDTTKTGLDPQALQFDRFEDVVREMGLAFVHSVMVVEPGSTPLRLTISQMSILETYAGGDLAHLAQCRDAEAFRDGLRQCGDGLLKFLMAETSVQESCLSSLDTLERIEIAIRELSEVHHAVQRDPEWTLG